MRRLISLFGLSATAFGLSLSGLALAAGSDAHTQAGDFLRYAIPARSTVKDASSPPSPTKDPLHHA